MVVALQMVQNRVAEIGADLPPDTQLQIERMTPEIFPVFILSLTGALPTADLYDYANFVVKPEMVPRSSGRKSKKSVRSVCVASETIFPFRSSGTCP